jgi:geranylgeranyl pyrophosphate synthase
MSERSSFPKGPEAEINETSQLIDATALIENEKIRTRINLINEEIKRCLLDEDGEPALLYETTRHLILAGGKRLRSLLLILCCEAVGGTVVDALPFAVATEFVQTASLIHDDVVDEDTMRRGVETTHEKYGRKMAIIAGDLLVALAIKLIGEKSSPELLTYVAAGGIKMCEGEAADLLMSHNKAQSYTTEAALDIIRMKTVSFMTSAVKVGAMLGKANESQLEALIKYSEMLGFSFQIRDDILDIVATQNGTGKTVLSDLRGSRSNYVLAHALEKCPSELKEEFVERLNEGDTDYALERISKYKSVEHSTEVAKEYMLAAKEAIRGFDFTNEELLLILADFAMKRLF